jgi:hypothetical protein
MIVIERPGQSPIVLHAPSDPALASLWDLAQLEFQARDGQEPVTQADWAVVTARYHALVTERRAELGAVIREVRTGVEIKPVRGPLPLRQWLTPFGQQIAAALSRDPTVTVRVVSATDAVAPMRQIIGRWALEPQFVMHPDGTPGDSWLERPDVFIHQWTSRESAIVLTEDADGPCELRFLTRISTDAIRVTYRLGSAPVAALVVMLRAAWDLGIRHISAEFHGSRAPERWRHSGGLPGLTERITTPRGDGWYDQVVTLLRRPERVAD